MMNKQAYCGLMKQAGWVRPVASALVTEPMATSPVGVTQQVVAEKISNKAGDRFFKKRMVGLPGRALLALGGALGAKAAFGNIPLLQLAGAFVAANTPDLIGTLAGSDHTPAQRKKLVESPVGLRHLIPGVSSYEMAVK